MAAEQDELAAGNLLDAGGSWGDPPVATGGPDAAAPALATSVWQQSVAAWQEAGIDWLREAHPGPSAEERAAAEADLQHTEPIPVVPAFGPPDQAGTAGRAAEAVVDEDLVVLGTTAAPSESEAAGAGTGTVSGQNAAGTDDDVIVLRDAGAAAAAGTGGSGDAAAKAGSVATGDAAAKAGSVTTGDAAGTKAAPTGSAAGTKAAPTGAAPTGAAAGTKAAATGTAATGTAATGTGSVASGETAAGDAAGAAQAAAARTRAAPDGTAGGPGRTGPSRRVIVVAAATSIALVAGTIAGVAIARSGGPAGPTSGLVTPYPAATLAAGDFAAPAAGPSVPPSLTGMAGARKTIVAVGSQGAASLSMPLILVSRDGGQTWARAALRPGGVAPGPGAVPVLVTRGQDSWLALGQHSAWTSATGRVWQAAPGPPMLPDDKILGLTHTRFGFIAVGENIPGPAGSGVPTPVLWTSVTGQAWQRKSGAALTLGASGGLDAGGGSMMSLRWAAYRGGVIIVGGEISRPVVEHRGKHRIIVNVESPGLWRSSNNGATWQPVKVPVRHGATAGLAGLAATGSAFVVIRPGRTLTGRRDAVAYVSGAGSVWRYAGRLVAGRRAPLHVLTVSASDRAFVVSGTTPASRVAFVSATGRGWHKTADQGRAASTTVTGVTVAPGSIVVAAGLRHRPGSRAADVSPYLLRARAGAAARRTTVGTAVLAAAGTADAAVTSLAAAGGEQVAAGTADGAPALWWVPADGHWAPATLAMPAAWHPGSLTGVVHGGSGWLAVGQAGPPAQPGLPPPAAVAVTSADGRTWRPAASAQQFAAPGTVLTQAAIGPAAYVVVGSAPGPDRSPAAAAWSSIGLSTWTPAAIGTGAAIGPGPAGQMLAVTADRSGFAAVGAVGNAPVVWTSPTGSAWQPIALPLPPGTASAVLTRVAAVDGRVVAVGNAATHAAAGPPAAGAVAFAAVSTDGGRHWRETVLRGPAGPATVTALTAAGSGFVAAGLTGQPGTQAMLTWWSPDGLSWQRGQPLAGPLPGRGVQQLTALSAVGGVLTGAGYAVTQSGEQPIRWQARYH
jgi:hypothetical protein